MLSMQGQSQLFIKAIVGRSGSWLLVDRLNSSRDRAAKPETSVDSEHGGPKKT